jgi:formylmethanofuran dehydrogenase subunit E
MENKLKEELEAGIKIDLISNCSTKFHYESAPEHLNNDIEEIMATILDIVEKPTNDSIIIQKNTLVICNNCGNDYEIQYTKKDETEAGSRICDDCIEAEL